MSIERQHEYILTSTRLIIQTSFIACSANIYRDKALPSMSKPCNLHCTICITHWVYTQACLNLVIYSARGAARTE